MCNVHILTIGHHQEQDYGVCTLYLGHQQESDHGVYIIVITIGHQQESDQCVCIGLYLIPWTLTESDHGVCIPYTY